MALLPSDISRLIHHHLLKEGYVKSANTLVEESPHLLGLPKPVSKPYKLPRLIGPALVDLLEALFETKDYVIEELESLNAVNYKEHESLATLIKTLLNTLKCREQASAPIKVTLTCDASFNTDEAPLPKESRDAITNTDVVFSQPMKCDASCNTEALIHKEIEDVASKTVGVLVSTPSSTISDKVDQTDETQNVLETSPDLSSNFSLTCTEDMGELQHDNTIESSPGTDDAEIGIIDFSMIYDRLLEDTKLHEKIAKSINKKKAEVLSPCKEPVNETVETSLTQDLSSVIKAIVAETQSDPAFEDILRDCIGIDESRDASTVKDPLLTENKNQEENHVNHPICPTLNCETGLSTAPLLAMNSFSGFAIVSGPNGQAVLVPTGVSLMGTDAIPAVQEKALKPKKPKPKKKSPVFRKVKKDSSGQVAILPRPEPPSSAPMIITVTIPEIPAEDDHPPPVNQQVSAAVASAVNEAIADFTPSTSSTSPTKPQQGYSIGTQVVSQRKPFMKINRPSSISRQKRQNHRLGTVPRPPPAASSSITSRAASSMTPALADLLKLAGEQCKVMESASTEEKEAVPVEPVVTTPSADSCVIVTTPTSTHRRRSHVRQLHFGESPSDACSSPVTSRPPGKSSSASIRSSPKKDLPWDSFLRTAVVAPVEPEESKKKKVIFATPKGKAKRVRKKSSPLASSQEKEKETPPTTESICMEEEEEPRNKTSTIVAEETSPVTIVINNKNIERPISSEKDKESPSISTAMNLPPPNFVIPNPQCSAIQEVIFQQPLPALPVLATPRKEPEENGGSGSMSCDGQSSSSFSAWIGEIPRTPQIQLDQNRSTSPFLVSLTKGFGFLPAADSPSLAVPATPSIGNFSASGSIETPYTGFYQFPSTLNTPRVDALRQERMESPGKTLSTTMISPTQVVLGRSAPYFVPSGERAQGPVINQNATPEHIPEPDKLEPSRRNSMDMEPLQLEESNDASDAAAALMRQAAASATAALLEEKRQLQPPTPAKTDQSLESDLINECRRLEDHPSKFQTSISSDRYIELFGEDSTTPKDLAVHDATKKDTALEPKKPKKNMKAKESSSCARMQEYVSVKRQNKIVATEASSSSALDVPPVETRNNSRKRQVNLPAEEAPGTSITKRSRKSSKRKSSSLNSSKEEVVDVLHVAESVPAEEMQTTVATRRSSRTPKKSIETARPSLKSAGQEIAVLLVDPVATNKSDQAVVTSTTKNSVPNESPKQDKETTTKTQNSGVQVPRKNPARSATKSFVSPPPKKTQSPRKGSPIKLSKPGFPSRGRKAISLNQSGIHKVTTLIRNTVEEVIEKESNIVEVPVEVGGPAVCEAKSVAEEPLVLNLTVEESQEDVVETASLVALEKPAEVMSHVDDVQLEVSSKVVDECNRFEENASSSVVSESVPTTSDIECHEATSISEGNPSSSSAKFNDSALDYLGLLPSIGTKVSTKIHPERVQEIASNDEPQLATNSRKFNSEDLSKLERSFVNRCQKMLSFSQEICIFPSK